MLKLFFIPLLFVTINSKNKVTAKKSDADIANDRFKMERIKEEENAAKTKMFVNNLAYQLLYGPVEIEYSLSGCFNFNYYKMTITKRDSEFYSTFLILTGSDYERVEKKYQSGQGKSFEVKLSEEDMIHLKNALVETKGSSTIHNYILIKQGNHFYELMDNNSNPPLYNFIADMSEKNYKRFKSN